MADPVENIWREASGKPAYGDGDNSRTRRKRERPAYQPRQSGRSTSSPGLPVASPRSSEIAQRWVDLAEERRVAVPFNANWLAHQISVKIGSDPRMREYLEFGRHEDVKRWGIKMAEKFWDEWVQASDKPKDMSHLFLDEVWDDVRDYAFDCLRASYLKEHGRPVAPPEPVPQTEGLIEDLRTARFQQWLEEAAAEVNLDEDHKRLDEHRRGVVRSPRRTARDEDK